MKCETIAIDKLKFDENQPRKTFPQDKIDAMAESIKAQGLLEPIQIDENNKIVNGECRARGCKQAGLKEVDVIRMNPKDQNDRWIKQLVSNYHRIPEEPLEQARILENLTKLYSDRQFRKQGVDSGIREISRLTGISKDTIENRLTLLEAPKEIQEAIERKEIKPTYVIEASKAEPEHRKEIFKKIKQGKYKDRDQIRNEIKYKKEIDRVNDIADNPIITPQSIANKHYEELKTRIRSLNDYILQIPNMLAFDSIQKERLSTDIKELILGLKELVKQHHIVI